jgi:hypothetical protein
MIGPTGAVRVMVATRPVDFRKGAEGLAVLVREHMGVENTPDEIERSQWLRDYESFLERKTPTLNRS